MGGIIKPAVAAAATALILAGCGDPVIIHGDPPGFMRLIAGSPDTAGWEVAPDGRARGSRLTAPHGLAAAGDGSLYVADVVTARILAVSSAGRLSVVVDHRGCPVRPCLLRPTGIALEGANALLIADPSAARLWRLDLRTGTLSTPAGTGVSAASPDGTLATETPIREPVGVAVGPDGRVYFSERGAHRVRIIEPDGALSTLAGTGTAGSAGDGGSAATARLSAPAGLAIGPGVLYIADTFNQRIRAVDLVRRTIETVAGTGIRSFGGDNGQARSAQLRDPADVAVTPDGRALYVSDAGNRRVRVVNLETGIITTFAGTGAEGFTGEGRTAGETVIEAPAGIAVSPLYFLYVADAALHIVWRTPIR